jgi:hypothetical protein
METFKTSKISWKLVACCFVLLVVFVLTVGAYLDERSVDKNPSIAYSEDSEVIPLVNSNYNENISTVQNEVELAGPKEEVANIYSINSYITTYEEDIELLCKAFGVNKEDIISDLKERAKNNSDKAFQTTNVGFLLDSKGNVKTFANDLYGLVEYFYSYVKNNPKKVNNKRVAYKGSADYVEKLIIYFSEHIYTDVDTTTALSIGAAESGYYKVKYMLACNNVYGGMGSNGLIKYKNIEFGVLSYVRYLSRNYYSKGNTSLEGIGRIYNPTTDSNGNKIASPHWISMIQTAKKKYSKYDFNLSIEDLVG